MESTLEAQKPEYLVGSELIGKLRDVYDFLNSDIEKRSDGSRSEISINRVTNDLRMILNSIQLNSLIDHSRGIKVPDIENDSIMASEIHPSQLRGLIPVSKPNFCGEDGKIHKCKSEMFEYNRVVPEAVQSAFSLENMNLIKGAVDKAKERKWKYLLAIFKNDNDDECFVIKGC